MIWEDQQTVFLPAARHLSDPYQVVGFFNPPWAALLLAPFTPLPLPGAVLAQMSLYFAALAVVMRRWGGGGWAITLTLTSFVAFDSALELNLEWLLCLGLLAPPWLSGLFLGVKPQLSVGALVGYSRHELVQMAAGSAAIFAVSLLLWGWWPARLQPAQLFTGHNLAPLRFLPWPLSLAIAALLGYRALKRHDSAYGLLAALFLTPYVGLYSLLPHLGALACRQRRLALTIHVCLWLIYGGVLVSALL